MEASLPPQLVRTSNRSTSSIPIPSTPTRTPVQFYLPRSPSPLKRTLVGSDGRCTSCSSKRLTTPTTQRRNQNVTSSVTQISPSPITESPRHRARNAFHHVSYPTRSPTRGSCLPLLPLSADGSDSLILTPSKQHPPRMRLQPPTCIITPSLSLLLTWQIEALEMEWVDFKEGCRTLKERIRIAERMWNEIGDEELREKESADIFVPFDDGSDLVGRSCLGLNVRIPS